MFFYKTDLEDLDEYNVNWKWKQDHALFAFLY